ncbi:MAG: sulfatase-like hydrolase/transferase [Planctomycetota bacterium]
MLQPRRRVVPSTLAVAVVVALAPACAAARAAADGPAVVIDRSPDPATVYVACPSVAILPDGTFVASHSWFGPGTTNDTSEVFRSADRGQTWEHAATVPGQWWSTLFVHRGDLYLLGVDREYGRIVIRRSRDGGRTWTTPADGRSGRLTEKPGYHGAPVPVAVHSGRLWRAFELSGGPAEDFPEAEREQSAAAGYNTGRWGDLYIRPRFQWGALVASVSEDADLLDATAWSLGEPFFHPEPPCQWIEGNVVAAPDGSLVSVLRTNPPGDQGQPARTSIRAAIVTVGKDGRLAHDPARDIVAFPGGGGKFTIRYDPETARYWSLSNVQFDPVAYRSIVALVSSADLRTWRTESIVLQGDDPSRQAWQYLDWQFDGPDLVAVSRTADESAHAPHDANLFTFHRINDFRTRGRPNVIVILADDVGWGDLSCYPQSPANPDAATFTPQLDSLAATGVRFTQATAQCMCSPSRAGLLTGRFPQRFGFYDLADAAVGLPASERTLAEVFRDAGYATACIGKWHLGRKPGHRPLDRGFERFFGFYGASHDYFRPDVGHDDEAGGDGTGDHVYDQERPVESMRHLTDEFTDRALDFIRASHAAGRPFFVYLPYSAAHGPLQPRPDLLEAHQAKPGVRHRGRTLARALIDGLDEGVGRILRELYLANLDDDTIVVFTSDNGGNEYETPEGIRTVTHNGGLRGCKFTTWEGGIRVPLIVRWPGHLRAGGVYDEPVNLVDLLPTLAAAARIPLGPVKPLDGVDLLPHLAGTNTGRPHELIHACLGPDRPQWSVRKGDWKLVSDVPFHAKPHPPVILGLYDLAADPGERTNLAARYPERVAELRREHEAFMASCPPSIAAAARKAGGAKPAAADLRLGPCFGDHMVLQREIPVVVWGTARAGERITVAFGGERQAAVADATGRFTATLGPLAASAEPRQLVVTGAEPARHIVLEDVLVGEVWLAGGQSNMGSRMREYAETVAAEIPRADHPGFRVLTIDQRATADAPPQRRGWETVSPETAPTLSATAYFFGRDLHRHLGVPVGIVVCAWGGTLAENWISRDTLLGHAETRPLVAAYDAILDRQGGAAPASAVTGQRRSGRAPKEPMGPRHFQRPGGLYETMLLPLAPFTVRGIVFYQGESNASAGRSFQYRHLLPLVVADWRRAFGADLPFLAVMLPVFRGRGETEWAELRESQLVACRDTPGCGLACVLEFGEADKLHPPGKEGVGGRLALLARGMVYGEPVAHRSPEPRATRREGERILVEFDHAAGGLEARGSLDAFTIAAADGRFVPAEAQIVAADTVAVWSPAVTEPVAVRHGWRNQFTPALYSRAGLPAVPFRTDSLPLETEGVRAAPAAVELPEIFADHMVLQRGRPVPVWGTAEPGAGVMVEFAGQRQAARADTAGGWRVALDPLDASAEPRVLTVTATPPGCAAASVTFTDVLVGEVWMCGGQSNMFWPLGPCVSERKKWQGVENGEAEVAAADWPLIRLNGADDHELGVTGWRVCTPEHVRGFSAVGYFFGRELHRQLDVPVGLVLRSIGGTSIQGWTPAADLEAVPFVRDARRRNAGGGLHERYIAPLVPFAMRGTIWYQGESNTSPQPLAEAYGDMLEALVNSRRRLWNDPAHALHVVQLPLFAAPKAQAAWHVVREGQRRASDRLAGVGLVVTYDVCDPSDLHPAQKAEVGRRLALVALSRDYGRPVEGSGPAFRDVAYRDGEAIVTFAHAAGLATRDGQAPRGFTLAGADGVFHPAEARIEGEAVVLRAAAVPKPSDVRFFYGGITPPNLLNGAGLPAGPFSTTAEFQ